MKQQDIIRKLLQMKGLVSSKVKSGLLRNIDNLSESQLDSLRKILIEGSREIEKIDFEYDQKELPLKKKYLDILNDPQGKIISEAIRKVENKEEKGKRKKLENIIEELNET